MISVYCNHVDNKFTAMWLYVNKVKVEDLDIITRHKQRWISNRSIEESIRKSISV